MHRKLAIYLVIGVIAIAALFVRHTYFAGKWHWHEDNNAHFALAYPATWFKGYFYHCATCQYIDLLVRDTPVLDKIELRLYSIRETDFKPPNATSFGKWLIYQNSDHVHVLTEQDVRIGKYAYSGKEVTYEDGTFHGRIVTIRHNGKIYAIEINAIEKNWKEANAVFAKILETFVFLK